MTKKILLLIIPIFIVSCKVQQVSDSSVKYTSLSRQNYIENYKDLAINEMKRTGIPASIKLAQAMLESDNGNSTLARKANNHFGIKCHNGWIGGTIYHDDDERGECFRRYKTVYESYIDHSDFIVHGMRYAFLFEHDPTDYKAWARGLQKAGYATSRTYANLLIKIIEDNQLYVFDRGGTLNFTSNQENEPDSDQLNLADVDNFTVQINKHRVYNKNRIDYIIVKNGDTFKKLTEEFELLSWELYKYNELEEGASLEEGQILYLQPKRNRAEHGFDFHTVSEGETMYKISQMYGIKLKKLYEKNRMEVGTEPEPGQKLWLRKRKPESEVVEEESEIIEFEEF
ncbi:MAG: glucosaminidase domain-containing protein [Thiohalospira sp.]